MVVREGLEAVAEADTVMVTGGAAREDVPPAVLDALRTATAAGARVASICTGAFVLAAAGLLEHRRATTYWLKSDSFRRRYPDVHLEPDVLFVEDGPVLTSAGLAAGIDLCLHIIRSDHGAAVANQAARLAVVAPVRPGGRPSSSERRCPRDRHLARRHPGVGRAATRRTAHAHRPGPPRPQQRPHPHPPVPGRDGPQPAAVAAAPASRPGPRACSRSPTCRSTWSPPAAVSAAPTRCDGTWSGESD
nr:AraC family transcriptional regulator [Angustibacter aerolatus]